MTVHDDNNKYAHSLTALFDSALFYSRFTKGFRWWENNILCNDKEKSKMISLRVKAKWIWWQKGLRNKKLHASIEVKKTGWIFTHCCYRFSIVTHTVKCYIYRKRERESLFRCEYIHTYKHTQQSTKKKPRFQIRKGSRKQWLASNEENMLDNNLTNKAQPLEYMCNCTYIEHGKCTKVLRFSFSRHFSFAFITSQKPSFSIPIHNTYYAHFINVDLIN